MTRSARFRRRCALLLLGAAAFPAVLGSAAAASSISAPGYRLAAQTRLGAGVEHVALTRRGREAVHIAKIAHGAPYDLRAVPANGALGHGLERTSSMCRRTDCMVAVNGDFWNPATAGVPAGAVISLGEILRPPSANHFQLAWSPDQGLATGQLTLHGTLVTSDLESLPIETLNAPLGKNGIGAYTRAWGPVTGSGSAFEIVLTKVEPPGRLTLSRTLLVRFADAKPGAGTAIPADGLVLTGRGKGAKQLKELWAQSRAGKIDPEALLRIESTPSAMESVGGSPVLLRGGRRVFEDAPTSLVRNRHPRTIVGRTRAGDVLLVTVDGRQPGHSDGMTLAEAADLMSNLGAVDALNLDGGGSSTFVVKGRVINRPSDRAVIHLGRRKIVQTPGPGDKVLGLTERPVATSVQVVPRTPAKPRSSGTGVLQTLETASPENPSAPYATDPGSDPTGRLPAIVVPVRSRSAAWPLAALALALTAATLTAMSHRVRLRVELAR